MSEPRVYWLNCPEGQKRRRVRLVREGDLPGFALVRDVETGDLLAVAKGRIEAMKEADA